jgi:hypothetical protein
MVVNVWKKAFVVLPPSAAAMAADTPLATAATPK